VNGNSVFVRGHICPFGFNKYSYLQHCSSMKDAILSHLILSSAVFDGPCLLMIKKKIEHRKKEKTWAVSYESADVQNANIGEAVRGGGGPGVGGAGGDSRWPHGAD